MSLPSFFAWHTKKFPPTADSHGPSSLTTCAALLLDLYVWRHGSRRGMYRLQDSDRKPLRADATHGAFTDDYDDEDENDEEGFAGASSSNRNSTQARTGQKPYAMRDLRQHSSTTRQEEEEDGADQSGYAGVAAHDDEDTGYHHGMMNGGRLL
nr:hypothetical protein CFP56_65866 [Quercus suber]